MTTPADFPDIPMFFFGVAADTRAGHYLHIPGGAPWHQARHPPSRVEQMLPPALRRIDGVWTRATPRTPAENSSIPFEEANGEQGRAFLHYVEGWTVAAWWDRSADPRGACNANFLAPGRRTFEQMLTLAREHFPREMERMEKAYTIRLVTRDLPPDDAVKAAMAFVERVTADMQALDPAVRTHVGWLLRDALTPSRPR